MLLSQIEGFHGDFAELPEDLQAAIREAARTVVMYSAETPPATWDATTRRQARANAESLLLKEWSASLRNLETLMNAIDRTIEEECENPEQIKELVRGVFLSHAKSGG